MSRHCGVRRTVIAIPAFLLMQIVNLLCELTITYLENRILKNIKRRDIKKRYRHPRTVSEDTGEMRSKQ